MTDQPQQPPTWFGDYLRSLTDQQLFTRLYDGMRGSEFRLLLSEARRWDRARQKEAS